LSANGIALLPEVFGFFINPAIGTSAGAQKSKCSDFPAPGPVGAPPDKNCIQVPAELEDEAGALVAAGPTAASPERKRQLLELLRISMHEMEHAHFDDTQAAMIAGAADCNLSTEVFHGPTTGSSYSVKFYLSELAAITSEFEVYFQNLARNSGEVERQALETEEQQQAFNQDESLLGIIRALQCVCSCATVDSFVTQTVNLATATWPPDQTLAFLKTMTLRIPGVWPSTLKRR
jgi:hypothetical protein